MPWYRRHGKIESPLTFQDFLKAMQRAVNAKPEHRAFAVLLFYWCA